MKRYFFLLLFLFSSYPALAVDLSSLDVGSDAISALPAAPEKQSRNVYIIQLKENPVLGYQGGIQGIPATKPQLGKKAAMRSSAVKSYKTYLREQQDEILNQAGIAQRHTVYNYTNAFNGVAANLTDAEVEKLAAHGEVVSVFRDEMNKLQNDSTPDFLNLTDRRHGAWRDGVVGEDVIVGVLDSGIYPEHPSFADVATPRRGNRGREIPYGPPPAGWTGDECSFGNTDFNSEDAPFTCNNKVLGGRYYAEGFLRGGDPATVLDTGSFLSARDDDGHGSAAASNAAGNNGVPAVINGQSVGAGPISGVAPRARIAAYKVCWVGPEPGTDDDGCFNSDSMAAIDQAVEDGVDVINYSIGGSSVSFGAPNTVAFLFAADAGVHVASSAGNSGPLPATAGAPAVAPWITSVGAINDDQNFALGVGVNAPSDISGEKIAIEGTGAVVLEDTGAITADVVVAQPAEACDPLTNAADVAGKIALVIRGTCTFDAKYAEAEAAGAVAIVVYNDGTAPDRVNPFSMSGVDPSRGIPGVMIGFADGDDVANSVEPNMTLDASIQISQENTMAGFSSRGPNLGALDIIKPDVVAPGVSILSAETPFESADSGAGGQEFQFISGTSFSGPHVAGALALLKQAYPDWSPAQARSALMTTARQDISVQFTGEQATPFDMGAGHIEVNDALDPGLTYDVDLMDYAAFSCGNNVQLFSDGACEFLETSGFSFDGSELNLPSIGVGELLGTQTVTRTVTNVSERRGRQTYRARVEAPEGINVVVIPDRLRLRSGESATYSVTFTADEDAVFDEFAFGSITWVRYGNGRNNRGERRIKNSVRSPIAVRPVPLSAPLEVEVSGADGTAEFDVQFGYSGDYTAELRGIAAGIDFPDTVLEEDGLNVLGCFPLPDHTLLRFATFDQDTTTPGQDDIDLRMFRVDDCATFAGAQVVGSSGGITSEEVVDVVNPSAGFYVPVVDFFASGNGDPSIDYTAWLYLVVGDEENATLVAPSSATLGASETVQVEYELGTFAPAPGQTTGDPIQRGVGVVIHSNANGEVTRTVVDIDGTQ